MRGWHHAYGAPLITWLWGKAGGTGIDLKVDGLKLIAGSQYVAVDVIFDVP
jgi:hypothetical protein